MFNGTMKRFSSLIMAVVMVFGVLTATPLRAKAANISGLSVTGLTASSDNGTWSAPNGTSINGSVKTTVNSGCTGDSYEAVTGTLTLTNSLSTVATLSFTYTFTADGGSGTVDGTAATASASFTKKLAAGETVQIVISSNANGAGTTQISLTNIRLAQEKDVTVTFMPASGGSYTVDGTAITAQTSITKKSTESFALKATPASGYKFFGWKSTVQNSYVSKNTTFTFMTVENDTITPEFYPSTTPVFGVGDETFTELNAAISYASSNNKPTIVLLDNGTLPAGNYSIPNGKTLLIPFDSANTVVKDTPTVIYNTYSTPTAYKILTMANGATITVQSGGAISLGSQLSSKGQMGGYNGTPTGPDGRINMQSGSNIIIKSGANLYCWGYIYGSGSVTAESGSTVYEAFQIKDWRGGTATSNVYDYAFILSQYYIQNIEVPLTIYAGAIEKLYSSANASSSAYPMGVTFVGSGGLFNISSGYLVKDYIESTDRLNIEINGNASVTPMTLTGLPLIGSVQTGEYELPINSNITIDIKSGTTSVTQDIKLLPSVEVKVAENANLTVNSGKKLYVYDNDDWGNFTGNARLYVVGYSVANGTTTKRTAAGLVDAKLDVNGTVTVAGNMYTSAGGANITSSQKIGQVVLSKAPGTADSTIYEMAGNSTKTAVVFNPARLHNGDDSFTETAGSSAGTTYYYCPTHDKWETERHELAGFTITWKNWDNTVLKTDTNVTAGTVPSYTDATPTRPATAQYTYTFSGWDPTPVAATADATYTATYSSTVNNYTVSFNANGHGTAPASQTVAYGSTANTPTAPTANGYTFGGWYTEAACTNAYNFSAQVTGNVTLYAKWTAVSYAISYDLAGGTVATANPTSYTIESNAITLNNPTKEGYTFAGWTGTGLTAPTVNVTIPTGSTGNRSYTATWTINTYTVTWADGSGNTLKTDTFEYGATPVYDGTEPTKAADADYVYTFAGWASEPNQESGMAAADLPAVTANVTYYAAFSKTAQTYTYDQTGWVWTGDDENGYTAATAKFTAGEGGFTKELPAEITTNTTAATCTTAGSTVYTATVTYNGGTYTDSKTVAIPALGHSWSEWIVQTG